MTRSLAQQTFRVAAAVLVAGAIQFAAGCAAWQTRNWDLSQLRDPRAADVDQRLQQSPPLSGTAFHGAGFDAQGADTP